MMKKWVAAAALVSTAIVPGAAPAQTIYAQRTIAGQPLVAPPGPMEVTTTRIAFPAQTAIPMHMHFWPRYVYVESGEVRVTVLDSGDPRTFKAGQLIVEPLQKWHSVVVAKGTVLIAVEQVPPGGCNTIKPPAPDSPNDQCPRP
jgi:quercetin dioxygenase-like cupin family protein